MHQIAPNSSGASDVKRTFKQMFMSIWKVSKKQPVELKGHSDTPPHFAYIWEWFFDFTGIITWLEIKAWSEISGIVPSRWEGIILIRLSKLTGA